MRNNEDNLNWQAAELRKWQRHPVRNSFTKQNIRYYRRMLRYYEKEILKEAQRYTASFKIGDLIWHNAAHYHIVELRGGFAHCWINPQTYKWVRLDDLESAL